MSLNNVKFNTENFDRVVEYQLGTGTANTVLSKGKFNVISNYKFIDISSTKIRSDIYKYRKYLDDRVFKYIIDNKLYGGSYE